MKRKNKLKKGDAISIPGMDVAFLQAIGKIRALDDRVRRLVSYVEYIACKLDTSVNYSEFIAKNIKQNNASISDSTVVTFAEFEKNEIPPF